jgi:hypothetical protein
MDQLEFIVDSLNLKFKTCELDKGYLAVSQAKGHYISLKSKRAKAAQEDLKNNIYFEEFIKKYPLAEVSKDLLIIQDIYENYNNETIVEISNIDLNDGYDHKIKFHDFKKYKEITSENGCLQKAENNLRAFFIPNGLKTLTLADSYARMIRYTDCMIDTSSLIIKENAQRSWTEMNNDYDEMSLKEKNNY